MAFVTELVPEWQKFKFDPEVFKLSIAFPPISPFRWTIDRERDIFLIQVGASGSGGGQGDGYIPPYFYTLSWKGRLVKFDVRVRNDGNDSEVFTWEIFNIIISLALEDKKEEAFAILKEAIKAVDSPGRPTSQHRIISILF